MNIVQETLSNGNTITYKIVNDTFYHNDTSERIIDILENARKNRGQTRLRFAYGDIKTGRDWGDTYDTVGYIGRSMGRIKIPLLIKTTRSSGGPGLLDHCIIRIEQKTSPKGSYQEVYRHPSYHKD